MKGIDQALTAKIRGIGRVCLNFPMVSPVGAAWFQVLEEKYYPLHCPHLDDWNHPSLRGSYLMACTVFSTLFQASSVGIPFYAGLPQGKALYFQEVASRTVLNTSG